MKKTYIKPSILTHKMAPVVMAAASTPETGFDDTPVSGDDAESKAFTWGNLWEE